MFETRHAVHLWKQEEKLFDFFLSKVAKFNNEKPVFYLDSHNCQTDCILNIFKPYGEITDLSADFEILACCMPSADFKEGQRMFMEEQGNMMYDEETQKHLTGYVSFVDPRTRFLGLRIISIEGCIDYYKTWRILNGVCEGELIMKNKAEHLNFQYFNGKKSNISDAFILCGAISNSENQEQIYNKAYSRKIDGLRLVDKKNNIVGKVFESINNIALIKALSMDVHKELYLEDGEKINVWPPQYIC
jgi:hypothetical protein